MSRVFEPSERANMPASFADWQEQYKKWLEHQSLRVKEINAEFPCGSEVRVRTVQLSGGRAVERFVHVTVMNCNENGVQTAREDPKQFWPPRLEVWDLDRVREFNREASQANGRMTP